MKTQLFSDDALSVMKEACILVVASLEINQMDGATFCEANLFYFQVEDSHRDKRNVTLVNSWTTQKYQKKRENKGENTTMGRTRLSEPPPPRPPKSLVIKVAKIDGGKELDGGGRMTFFSTWRNHREHWRNHREREDIRPSMEWPLVSGFCHSIGQLQRPILNGTPSHFTAIC